MIYTAKEAKEIAARFNWQRLFYEELKYPSMYYIIMNEIEEAIHKGLNGVSYDYSWIGNGNTFPNEYKDGLIRLGYSIDDDCKGLLYISWATNR
jgi:hypothetical protein